MYYLTKNKCEKPILLASVLFLLFYFFVFSCKTPPFRSKIADNKKTSKIGRDHENLAHIIKEGWIDDNTFNAYKKSLYLVSLEEHIVKVRERLVWLLLAESYEVTPEDRYIAEWLAKSRLLVFGQERIFHKIENGNIYILMQRKGQNLRGKWKRALLKIEDTFSRLKTLRKN